LAPVSVLFAALALGCSSGDGAGTFTIVVTVALHGGGAATVMSDPAGLSCAQGTCEASFAAGTPVTLTATPGAARFVRWTGACSGAASTCRVGGDATVGVVFLGANYVFTTSTLHAPVGLTPIDADAACAARATAAGLPGTYVAWLSTTTMSAVSRIATARGWVRTDGRPFADSPASLTSASAVLYPAALDELGAPVDRSEVLTGTGPSGALMAGYNCRDWSSGTGPVQFGDATAGPTSWTSLGNTPCSTVANFHLYCFGTDSARPIAVTPAGGRIAFLSGPVAPGGGVAAFDAACAAEAAAVGLRGTFRALVATNTASAASRFDLSGPPWVRPDGVAVVTAAADLVTTALLAPIAVRADGTYSLAPPVWTGAISPNVTGIAKTNCSDWTDGTASGAGAYGHSAATQGPPPNYRTSHGFFWVETTTCGTAGLTTCTATQACDQLASVFCLEQ